MALKATLSPIRSCCRMYLPVPRVHHRGIRSLTSQLPSSMYTKYSFPRSSFPQTILRQFMINTEATPNPDSMKFFPNGQKVLESGTMDFPDLKSTKSSPLAALLFRQAGVKRVFLAENYISITKDEDLEWDMVRTIILGTLTEFYASGQPVLLDEASIPRDTEILDTDSEEVAMIKELLETRVRPQVQEDGGDITYLGFVDGVVFLLMQGSITLKSGIERMLMHWIPQVQGVMAVESREEFEIITDSSGGATSDEALIQQAKVQSKLIDSSEQALQKLEEAIKKKKEERKSREE